MTVQLFCVESEVRQSYACYPPGNRREANYFLYSPYRAAFSTAARSSS